jgi:flagellar biosynthesis/type III secretory pathway M-ring protein FliF/YscJ
MVYNNSAVDDLNEVLFPIFIFIRIIELINVAKYIAIGVACILIIRHIIRNRKKKQKG